MTPNYPGSTEASALGLEKNRYRIPEQDPSGRIEPVREMLAYPEGDLSSQRANVQDALRGAVAEFGSPESDTERRELQLAALALVSRNLGVVRDDATRRAA